MALTLAQMALEALQPDQSAQMALQQLLLPLMVLLLLLALLALLLELMALTREPGLQEKFGSAFYPSCEGKALFERQFSFPLIREDLLWSKWEQQEQQQQEQQQQEQQQQEQPEKQLESVADQQPGIEEAEEEVTLGKRPHQNPSELRSFKRKVKRRLVKNGQPVLSSSSRPSSPIPPSPIAPEATPLAPAPSTALASISQAKFTAMKAFNFERFKLGLPDVSRGQYDMLIQGQRPVVPSMTAALLLDLHPPLVRAVMYRGSFAETLFNRFIRISTRFKIKYKNKLSLQRFIFQYMIKSPKNLFNIQLSFAEAERFNPSEWETAYPNHHAQCRRLKISPNEYHNKSLFDLRKRIGLVWASRYMHYYQAKDAALSVGLYWNITLHEFLTLAAIKKFIPLHIRNCLDHDKTRLKHYFYKKRHIKSVKKLSFTSPTYDVDPAKFDHSFPSNEQKLWKLIEPFLAQKFGSAFYPSCEEKALFERQFSLPLIRDDLLWSKWISNIDFFIATEFRLHKGKPLLLLRSEKLGVVATQTAGDDWCGHGFKWESLWRVETEGEEKESSRNFSGRRRKVYTLKWIEVYGSFVTSTDVYGSKKKCGKLAHDYPNTHEMREEFVCMKSKMVEMETKYATLQEQLQIVINGRNEHVIAGNNENGRSNRENYVNHYATTKSSAGSYVVPLPPSRPNDINNVAQEESVFLHTRREQQHPGYLTRSSFTTEGNYSLDTTRSSFTPEGNNNSKEN
ncbi:hypothetical protein Taro_007368 [Colocasia esculenta]|uniref:Uncharacterized protein n=1 Tax=Colocasia esculenta TaxID=4460 RepID=A0A843TTX2_COLES|nr:hypothetical protein [Colocasia esculenta]